MCKHCEENNNIFEPIVTYSTPGQTNMITIKNKKFLYSQIGFSYMYQEINYCPMCGKKVR